MMSTEPMRRASLGHLCADLDGAHVPPDALELEVTDVADDSRNVTDGSLFVAIPGTEDDGRAHVADAVARGAAAVVSESALELDVPVVTVEDARAAIAHIAAEWFDRPVDKLRLVGITGTVGKTSVMTMLGEILCTSDIPTGTIGSLGISYEGCRVGPAADETSLNTTPGALELQRILADMVDAGIRVAAMEVTSHALVQQRVRGLNYDVGIFTNLTMLEHMEYHGSFRDYAAAKAGFLELLAPRAPLIYSAGDRVVRNIARLHSGPRISCGGGGALVTIHRYEQDVDGSHVTLNVSRPLPLLDGSRLGPLRLPLELRTLGRTGIMNATLAAVSALCLGARPNAVHRALKQLVPPRRRMQVLHDGGPTIIDDTVGHPDSITGVFEVAESIPHARLIVAFVIRGQRGEEINVRDAEAIAIWSRRVPIARLVVSSAVDTANERNAVTDTERDAFLRVLGREGLETVHHERLDDALKDALGNVARDDLVLLLGAQGMDAGAAIVERLLAADGSSDFAGL